MNAFFFIGGVSLSGVLLFSPFSTEAAIPNFHEVEDGFFRGGQPDAEEIEALSHLGIRTVVSFRNEETTIRWEKEQVDKNGMTFVSIPLDWRRIPTDEEARSFLRVASHPDNRPLFVHCREGRDRTGTMVALYRIARQGTPVEEAYDEAKRFGFREAALPLKEFIKARASLYGSSPLRNSFQLPPVFVKMLFYAFEVAVMVSSLLSAITCLRRPELAIDLQKKFYACINWRMEPISMEKERKNTRILGGILLTVSFFLAITLAVFLI